MATQTQPRPIALHVSLDAERQLRFGHPWLYAQGIAKQDREGRAGDLAAIYDRRNRFLALGLYDPASPIRVRILQRHRPAKIDARWLAERMDQAVRRRAALARSRATTGYRLVHGENDALPGLVVDRYDRTLVLKLYAAAWAPHLSSIVEALDPLRAQRLVLRLSRAVQAAAGTDLEDGRVLNGERPEGPVPFLENGLRFEADVLRGQKTGFFLDQRDNRAHVERLSRGRRVLDGFAYTGAFSVYAARGGAREVTSVEYSRAAFDAARRHMALNRAYPGVARVRHHLTAGDTFEVLQQLWERKKRYDLVILDPPSFANARQDIPAALKAYHRLAELGLAVLEPGGVLAYASCTGQVSAEAFLTAVHRAARAMKRPLKELLCTGQPLDHPIGFPEGAYLKCLFASA